MILKHIFKVMTILKELYYMLIIVISLNMGNIKHIMLERKEEYIQYTIYKSFKEKNYEDQLSF